jgi:hypothetical protein
MWSAWQDALAVAAADSPDRMAWEKAAEATVITQEAAHLAMVRMLEAVADIESRFRIRNLLALECEFIETESTEAAGPPMSCFLAVAWLARSRACRLPRPLRGAARVAA